MINIEFINSSGSHLEDNNKLIWTVSIEGTWPVQIVVLLQQLLHMCKDNGLFNMIEQLDLFVIVTQKIELPRERGVGWSWLNRKLEIHPWSITVYLMYIMYMVLLAHLYKSAATALNKVSAPFSIQPNLTNLNGRDVTSWKNT